MRRSGGGGQIAGISARRVSPVMRSLVCREVGRRWLRRDSVPEQPALLVVEHFVWRRDALPDSQTLGDYMRPPSQLPANGATRRSAASRLRVRIDAGTDSPTIPAEPERAPRGRSARRTGRAPRRPRSRGPRSRGIDDRSGPAGCVQDLEKSDSGGLENDGRIRRIARDAKRVEHRLAASPRPAGLDRNE